ncbi:MAG: hypothetical protein IJO70_07415 [Lachnospiraceae bacterium]|nr:hypothetical protein [Lachnospiraceae bacterium]
MMYRIKKIISCFVITALVLGYMNLFLGNYGTVVSQAATKSMANVVLFVDFQDTDHSTHESNYLGECFLHNPETTFNLFNGDDENITGMSYYLDTISYGQLKLVNIFPQYNPEAGEITPFKVSKNVDQYLNRESSTLLSEVLEQLDASGLITSDMDLDLDDDGVIDNVTLVVAYNPQGDKGEEPFTSHKSSVGGAISVAGYKVNNYNLVTESGAYLGLQKSGLLIHEFMHTLTYPDLYRVGAASGSTDTPVGLWDIMAKNSYRLQYPLAYLRSNYTGWFDIPTITYDVENYSIYSATSATSKTKDNQALILKTSYSDTEFFVVEYRHTDDEYLSQAYDNYVYGSGLIVYRVNVLQDKNVAGETDLIYVFRPGDSYDSYGHELGQGDLTKSFLSEEAGRTSYGSLDFTHTLSDGAITYSDGTNSGILISNVGSAEGDTISFDVTFAQGEFWSTASAKDVTGLIGSDAYVEQDGNAFILSATNTGFTVHSYNSTDGWIQLGDKVAVQGGFHKIVKCGNDIYVACVEYTSQKVNLYKYENSWKKVYSSVNYANEVDIVADAERVYIGYTYGNQSSSGWNDFVGQAYCEAYSPQGVINFGEVYSGVYPANPVICLNGDMPIVAIRDTFDNNVISVRSCSQWGTSYVWSDVATDLNGANYELDVEGEMLYLMKNGDASYDYTDSYVYCLDLSSTAPEWEKLCDNPFTDESATPMEIMVDQGVVYLMYQDGADNSVVVKSLVDNQWLPVGTQVSNSGITDLSGFVYDENIYLVYSDTSNSKLYIKSHQYVPPIPDDPSDEEEPTTTEEPTTSEKPTTTEEPTTEEVFVAPDVRVSYRTHIQTYGWEGEDDDIKTWKSNGATSGTFGLSKRLEGINIVVNPTEKCEELDLGIQYTTHCQSYGWLPWSANGEMNGTEAEWKRLEAIKIQLTGEHAKYYDVYYRVHAQTYGWLGWAKNGEPSGTAGYSKRLEGIQIFVVKKGVKINETMEGISSQGKKAFVAKAGQSPIVNHPATSNTSPVVPGADEANVAYRTHVQRYGWQAWKYNGQMSGTSGEAKRLEAINIELRNKTCSGEIIYTTHVQKYGWQGKLDDQSTWLKNGQLAGTSGEGKRLEAICINLTGEMAERYDIYYRVHAQSFGWLSWAKNGDPAGTEGYGKRLEGIQIVLVPKGQEAPGSYQGISSREARAYIKK